MLTMTKERARTTTTAPQAVRVRTPQKQPFAIGTKKVKSPTPAARLMWVEQIAAVRDHKDLSAFAEVFAHFKSDDLTLRVQSLKDVFGNHAVAGSEFDDHPGGAEVDTIDRRFAQGNAAAREGSGSPDVAKAFEEK